MTNFVDPTLPLMTVFRENPDFNQADSEREMALLFERQRMIDQVVAGTIPVDELLDCLNDQGFDPDHYADTVTDNIEFHIANDFGRFVDPSDLDFFLRQ